MEFLKVVKRFMENLIPSIDELASVMFPDNVGNLFEPDYEIDVRELEKKYFKKSIMDQI